MKSGLRIRTITSGLLAIVLTAGGTCWIPQKKERRKIRMASIATEVAPSTPAILVCIQL